jgi:hypothetical protein
MFAGRCKGVTLMMESHKHMKLPLETLYLSVSVYDRVLLENEKVQLGSLRKGSGELQTEEHTEEEKLDLTALAIASLFSCHKL